MAPQRVPQGKKYIIIDTCVIQHAGSSDKGKSEAIIGYLKKLASDGYSLAISEFTLYENLHGLWGEKATQAAVLLGSYEWKTISNRVLLMASMLGGLYKEEGFDYMSPGDKIIASTAILEQGMLLTENHRDFPSPFFITGEFIPLTFEKSHHKRTIDLCLYRPNTPLIARRINEKDKL